MTDTRMRQPGESADDTLHRPVSNEARARVAVETGARRGLFGSDGATRADRRAAKRADRARRRDKHHAARRVAFFHYSYYGPVFKYFVEQVLNAEYLDMGEPTRRTLEIGSQHSNDYVCAPFKHIMGAYIEALDAGADVLMQFTGPCRLGYYGELQESILRDMGYDFEMLNFANVPSGSMKEYVAYCKRVVNPHLSIPAGVANLLACLRMVERMDSYNDAYLARAGFEVERGSFAAAQKRFSRTCATQRARRTSTRPTVAAWRSSTASPSASRRTPCASASWASISPLRTRRATCTWRTSCSPCTSSSPARST